MEEIVSAVETLEKVGGASRWKKLVQKFHIFREDQLPELWEKLGDSLAVSFNPILVQATTERMFLSLLKKNCDSTTAPLQASSTPDRQPTPSEECAVMYCGGYVVRKLEKRFNCHPIERAAKLVITLKSLCTDECQMKEEESLEGFIMKWMVEVNRGGLKIITEEALDLFRLVEQCTYKQIVWQSRTTESVCPDVIMKEILNNIDIQFCWCMLALDLNEDDSNTLLAEIVQLWINIRGHSHATALVEKYKWATASQVKQSKGIRKALKFKD